MSITDNAGVARHSITGQAMYQATVQGSIETKVRVGHSFYKHFIRCLRETFFRNILVDFLFANDVEFAELRMENSNGQWF